MVNKSKKVLTEISAGELLDKISILEIKFSKVKDKARLKEIKKEYSILKKTQKSNIKMSKKVKYLFNEVKKVNRKLWITEDKIRICEKNNNFGKNFIKLARDVYFNNDKRAKVKAKINKYLGSNIKEIKQYVNY